MKAAASFLICLAVPGLRCGTQDLQSPLRHVGSSSLTRGRTQAPCIGSMTIRPPGKSLRFCFLKIEEDVIHMKPPAQSDSTGGHIPNLLLLLFKITQSTLYVKRLPIIFISPHNTHLTSSSVVFPFYRWHQEVKWFTWGHTYSKFLKVTSKETWERLLHSRDPNSSPAQERQVG